jgi:hypothetical protein
VRSGPVLQIDALKILIYNIPWCPRTMAEQAKYAMRIKLTPKGWGLKARMCSRWDTLSLWSWQRNGGSTEK